MRIIYLDLDALNPSHLSCYGYHRNTSPTIDRIAREGLRCNGVYTSDAPCLPSRTAFYQGQFGIQTGVVGHGGTAADPKRQGAPRGFRSCHEEMSLPRQLQMLGYHTAMVSPFGQRHAAHHFYAGFKEIHNTGQCGAEPAEVVQPHIERWLDQHAAEDCWYLHINYWDIHTPYRAPLEYGNPFENEPIAAWLTDEAIARHVRTVGPHTAQEPGMYHDMDVKRWPRCPARVVDRKTCKQWIDGYDTAIRYVDDMIARIVEKLNAAGVYEDTAIIISADHGENQGQLGIYGEHGTADHATCHIPMIVKWPGGAKGKVDDALHYHLDWAPTLMDLIGGKSPEVWDGRSFSDTVRTARIEGRDELILSQCAHVCQRSVRWDRWLYIRTYHDGFRLYPQEMLFDLEADVYEEHDIAAQHPDICREGAWRLLRWHDEQMQKMVVNSSDWIDPMWTVIREQGPLHANPVMAGRPALLKDYVARLEATGRADGAAKLREKYPQFMK